MLVYFRLSLIIIVPRNPKKTLAQLWMSICEQKKSQFWLGLKGFTAKAFVELPTLAAQPQRKKPRHMTFVHFRGFLL